MLIHLHVKNLALIEEIEVDFGLLESDLLHLLRPKRTFLLPHEPAPYTFPGAAPLPYHFRLEFAEGVLDLYMLLSCSSFTFSFAALPLRTQGHLPQPKHSANQYPPSSESIL